ncbi:hypothetical protein Tco_1239199, partial [Tanacetum coccineum]
MKEVLKKEIIKLLDADIIYPIEDSPWISHVYCIPKKGGMTIVTNEKNELVPTRTVTGWRVCIDYRKLNEAIQKDHFSLPFMDQMLERLTGNKFFYFLDGFSRYFQILIEPTNQEKTTFTCPYGTYAYKQLRLILVLKIWNKYSSDANNWEKCHFMVTKDWSQLFELMCDASDFSVGAVLRQHE